MGFEPTLKDEWEWIKQYVQGRVGEEHSKLRKQFVGRAWDNKEPGPWKKWRDGQTGAQEGEWYRLSLHLHSPNWQCDVGKAGNISLIFPFLNLNMQGLN